MRSRGNRFQINIGMNMRLVSGWVIVVCSVSSCGHAGIINTLKRAQQVSGVEKIYALVGGFHLAPVPDEYLKKVMAELKTFDLEHIMPMHCSGQNFVDLAKQEMREKLVLCGTGSSFTFTAKSQVRRMMGGARHVTLRLRLLFPCPSDKRRRGLHSSASSMCVTASARLSRPSSFAAAPMFARSGGSRGKGTTRGAHLRQTIIGSRIH